MPFLTDEMVMVSRLDVSSPMFLGDKTTTQRGGFLKTNRLLGGCWSLQWHLELGMKKRKNRTGRKTILFLRSERLRY